MIDHPVLLLYNIDLARKSKICACAARLRIRVQTVRKSEYDRPLLELLQEDRLPSDSAAVADFKDPMLVMAGFDGQFMNAFLNALRASRMQSIALKAMLTPTNAKWNSIRLHDEILVEHLELHKQRK